MYLSHPPGGLPLRIALMLAVCAILITFPAHAADPPLPNVIFIAIDDLNDWVGFLGGHPQVRTPHMDALAKRGVVFTNAHCAAPLCSPSRAAIFTGKQPFHTGAYGNDDNILRIAPDAAYLPQHFKAAGYATYGTGKLLHQKSPQLFDETFFPEQRWSPFERDQVDYTPAEAPSKSTDNPRHEVQWGPGKPHIVLPLNQMPSDRAPNSRKGESFDWGPIDVDESEWGDVKITDWAIEKLSGKRDKPFFMAVGYYRPHIPLFAPAKYFEPYPIDSIALPPVREDDLADLSEIARRIAIEPATAGAHETVIKYNQWREAVAAYLACVTFVDAQIGRLVAALEAGPHAQDTHIIIWSDHGWHLGEKQHWGKWTGWERATRVPLLIAPAPASKSTYVAGARCDAAVSLIDLYPTLIDLCGLPPRDDLDGRSLAPLLRNPASGDDRVVITTFDRGNYSVRDERWRYIQYHDGSRELYDLQADPNEWSNLAINDRRADVISRLSKHLPHDVK